MYCAICGSELNVKYRPEKRNCLCEFCDAETAPKVSFDVFRFAMWPENERSMYGEPGIPVEREFYEDYRAYRGSLADYIADCTSYTL